MWTGPRTIKFEVDLSDLPQIGGRPFRYGLFTANA